MKATCTYGLRIAPVGWMRLFLVALMVPIFGCAGYQLGQDTLYRQDVTTVHVPIFQSDSFRRNLGEQLTEAVIKEIELKTPYVITSDPAEADSVLAGRVIRDRKYVTIENANDEPRDIETELLVEVSWQSRGGELIAQPYITDVPNQLLRLGQSVHFVPEGGQSIATAHQDAIHRLAEQIVAQMEVPW